MLVLETESDPHDLLNSLVKYPPTHLMDDPCTYVRHSLNADKVKGELRCNVPGCPSFQSEFVFSSNDSYEKHLK